MKRILVIVALSVLGVAPAPGADRTANLQAGEPPELRLTWRGHLFVGLSGASLRPLDDRLEAAGRPGVSPGFLSFGGGGQVVVGRLILGGEGAAMVQGAANAARGRQSLAGGVGFFDIGYVLHAGEKTEVSALLGIGGGVLSLRLDAARASSFDDILRRPGGELRLAAFGFLLQPALAVDVWPGRSILFLGVRAAYAIAPGRSRWELGYDEAAGGPDARLTGPSLRLIVGLGRR